LLVLLGLGKLLCLRLLAHLLGLRLSLSLLPLLSTDELPSLRVPLWHLVWVLGLPILRR